MDESNSKKCIVLFKQRQWFASAVHTPVPKPHTPRTEADGETTTEYKLTFTIKRNLIDAGWCWIGWGDNKVQLRMYVDLGAKCTFSTQGVYDEIVPKAAAGELGCVRVAPEIQPVLADGWNGDKVPMKNWAQLTVTADNVQGVQTICVGVYVSFGRSGDDRVLVAGEDLTIDLGFVHPTKQIEAARTQGVSDESLLGDKAPKRTYVLSEEEKRKRESSHRMAAQCSNVYADGLAYVGDTAFSQVRPMEWTQDPLLQYSYMTTAALHQAGVSATALNHEGVLNELSVQEFARLHDWITGHVDSDTAGTVKGLVSIDVLRVTSETNRLTRVPNVTFRVIESTAKRVVFGNDIFCI